MPRSITIIPPGRRSAAVDQAKVLIREWYLCQSRARVAAGQRLGTSKPLVAAEIQPPSEVAFSVDRISYS